MAGSINLDTLPLTSYIIIIMKFTLKEKDEKDFIIRIFILGPIAGKCRLRRREEKRYQDA